MPAPKRRSRRASVRVPKIDFIADLRSSLRTQTRGAEEGRSAPHGVRRLGRVPEQDRRGGGLDERDENALKGAAEAERRKLPGVHLRGRRGVGPLAEGEGAGLAGRGAARGGYETRRPGRRRHEGDQDGEAGCPQGARAHSSVINPKGRREFRPGRSEAFVATTRAPGDPPLAPLTASPIVLQSSNYGDRQPRSRHDLQGARRPDAREDPGAPEDEGPLLL